MSETFGDLTVVEMIGATAVCQCVCGTRVKRKHSQLVQSKRQGIWSRCSKCLKRFRSAKSRLGGRVTTLRKAETRS